MISSFLEQLVRLGLLQVEADRACNTPGDIHLRAVVQRPGRLLLQQSVEHLFELALHPRHFQDARSFVRPFVEQGIAHHHAHLRRELAADFPDNRMEGPAGLAGRVEELDQRDPCIGGAKDRGMRADEKRLIHRRRYGCRRLRFGLAAAGEEHGTAAEGDKTKGGGSDQKSAAVHGRRPFGRMRQTRMAANAASDR